MYYIFNFSINKEVRLSERPTRGNLGIDTMARTI